MHTHTSNRTDIPVCIYVYIPYLHPYTHTYVHTYIPTYIHTYIRTYVHTYKHTYIHTYIPTYLHTFMLAYIPTDRQYTLGRILHCTTETRFTASPGAQSGCQHSGAPTCASVAFHGGSKVPVSLSSGHPWLLMISILHDPINI